MARGSNNNRRSPEVQIQELALLLAGEKRSDVRDTIYGAITTVAATNVIGDNPKWIAAVDALGDVLKAIAQRERSFLEGTQEAERGSQP